MIVANKPHCRSILMVAYCRELTLNAQHGVGVCSAGGLNVFVASDQDCYRASYIRDGTLVDDLAVSPILLVGDAENACGVVMIQRYVGKSCAEKCLDGPQGDPRDT